MTGLPVNELVVRASSEADMARCAEIYRHHVLHGTASFEVDPPDLAEMKRRRAAVIDVGLPHLVAERDGRVMGYAYAGRWRPRPAYEYSVEDSRMLCRKADRSTPSGCRRAELLALSKWLSRLDCMAIVGLR